jgi:hypothetical protein
MANGALLGGYYPVAPYNFDVAPAPYLIGPIKSILTVVESRLIQLYADIATVQAMVTVQTATGSYLDAHGVLYATPRLAGEPDDAYRTRMLEALTAGKLTLAAIQTSVDNYLLSITNSEGILPTGYVYDLRSDPTSCAADAAAGTTIEILDFVVQITTTLSINDVWFLDYTPLDYETYLFSGSTTYGGDSTVDPALVAAVNRIKAAGTNAVFKSVVNFVNS